MIRLGTLHRADAQKQSQPIGSQSRLGVARGENKQILLHVHHTWCASAG